MEFTGSELTDYHSYLLRIWRDGPQRPWRASMQCAATGTVHYFADITHLLAFLQAQVGEVSKRSINEPEDTECK
jgi:hypothetical protein